MFLSMSTTPLMIEYEGPFDMDTLYKKSFDYISKLNYEVNETGYKNKTDELEISWIGKRKLNSYVQLIVEVEFHFWNLKDVEYSTDGNPNNKKRMKYGRFKITLKGDIETGYDDDFKTNVWGSTPFAKKLKTTLDGKILDKELEVINNQLFADTLKIQTFMKKVLGMESSNSAY